MGSYNPSVRTNRIQDIITAAGSGAILTYYNGTPPAFGGSAGTLLATLAFGGVIGTASAGLLTFSTTVTQTSSTFVSGTPTWFTVSTSANALVFQGVIGVDGTFAGTIATGVNIVMGASSITDGNA